MSKNDGKRTESLVDDAYKFKSGVVFFAFVDTYKARNFVEAQPSDRLLVYEGKVWLVEIKSSMDKIRFPLKNIGKKQLGQMRYWKLAGTRSIFIIHHLTTDVFYYVPFNIIDVAFKGHGSSIKWADLKQYERKLGYEFYNDSK